MEFFGGEALIFMKSSMCKPIFFRGMTQFFRGKPYFMEMFRGECNFSQSSGVRRKGKSSTGVGGEGTDMKCNSPISVSRARSLWMLTTALMQISEAGVITSSWICIILQIRIILSQWLPNIILCNWMNLLNCWAPVKIPSLKLIKFADSYFIFNLFLKSLGERV